MKKGTKKILCLTAASLAAMYAYNYFVEKNATSKNMLSDENGSYFNWKYGDIFYTKRGNGKPILLLHDISPESSGFEWVKIMKRLEKNHTVYTLDMLGCGRSEKPAMTYTNYSYLQMVTAFVKEIIGEKTDVIATNLSASVVITANNMDKSLFNKMILVNPVSMKEMTILTDQKSKIKYGILSTPFIGRFVYNVMMNPKQMSRKFRNVYFDKAQLIPSNMEDLYYEAAHADSSNGRYLYGSILGRYMNFDLKHALSKVDDNLYIIASRNLTHNVQKMEEYVSNNSEIDITYLSGCGLLPQLEIPEKFTEVLKRILEK